MGSCCTKDNNNEIVMDTIPTQEIIAPFHIIQSKNEIAMQPNPNTVLVGIYPIDNIIVYIFTTPNYNPQPNKFFILTHVIEVFSEQYVVDVPMIMKQIHYIRENIIHQ